MSVLVAHPSVAPFVQQAARAFAEAGQLDRLVTSLRYDSGSRRQDVVCALAGAVGFDLRAQLRRRSVTEIPLEKVESHPWGEIVRLLSGRIDRSGRLTDAVWERTEPSFDRLVARRVRGSHTAVYGYEYASRSTFERAKELGVRTAYDVPAPESEFVHTLLRQEMENFPELLTPYRRHTAAREERRLARRRAEWKASDLVIAASRFTRESYAEAGLDVGKMRVVPYGAPKPVNREEALGGGRSESEPMKFIWAGTFSVRKGAHYLLDAWRRSGIARHARLTVFGTVDVPERLVRPAPEGIDFLGPIPRERLMEEYRTSDALLFPTLCDGFGMVATEAWSRGTPVISTARAGTADLLESGKNGLLVPAADSKALVSALEWCVENRRELRAMREGALATAAKWQWSDYRQALAGVMREAGMFAPQ